MKLVDISLPANANKSKHYAQFTKTCINLAVLLFGI